MAGVASGLEGNWLNNWLMRLSWSEFEVNWFLVGVGAEIEVAD